MKTIAVLGAGASGMAAALAACENAENRVILLERQSRPGRKLLTTGNGRCNLTNMQTALCHYHGADTAFAKPALDAFGPEDARGWFETLGLLTVSEPNGRVYPLSDSAASVLDALRLALEARGAELRTGFEVTRAKKSREGFVIESREEAVTADALIICCGGAAGAKVGGGCAGYTLLGSFGHRRTVLRPTLVQLKTENTWTRPVKGVRTDAAVALMQEGSVLARSRGEVQFTDYGVSGPAVFEISRAAAFADGNTAVVLDLLPDHRQTDIIAYCKEKRSAFPDYTAEQLLLGTLHNALCRTVIRRTGLPAQTRLWALSDKELSQTAQTMKHYSLPLLGTQGFEEAQVTAGGMVTDEFDPNTMESRLVPKLYACGEVLDIDGDCGGYNLQWAWASGRLAGLHAGGLL